MVATDHVVIPHADTIITLTHATVGFAEWGPPSPESPAPELPLSEPPQLNDERDGGGLKKIGKGKKARKTKKAKKAVPRPPSPPLLQEPEYFDVQENEQPTDGPAEEPAYFNVEEKEQAIDGSAEEPAYFDVIEGEQVIDGPAEDPQTMSLFGGHEGDAELARSDADMLPSLAAETEIETNILLDDKAATEPDRVPPQDLAEEEHGDRYHVSSAILKIVSKRFETMLAVEQWAEGKRQPDGFFHIRAEGWDTEAFSIMLNVFHHRNYQVPRSVSLELMAKIAVLVDYYECEEAMKVYADIWIEGLRKSSHIPEAYCRDLILWILIARVFGLTQEFKQATEVAIKDSNEAVRTLELPIWPTIIDLIDSERYQAMESIMAKLCDLRNKYRDSAYTCPDNYSFSHACGSMLFGALTKEMEFTGLLSPRPEVPFTGLSLSGLADKVRSLQSPTWYTSLLVNRYNGYNGAHPCNLSTTVSGLLEPVMLTAYGLELKKVYTRVPLENSNGRVRRWARDANGIP